MSGHHTDVHAHGASGSSNVSELPAAPANSTPRPPPSPTQPNTGVNADCKIAALPEELLSNIAIKLGSDDLFAFRLACRDVEAKTLHEFAKEYFAAKCFLFSSGSLQVLVGISQSTKLNHYLKDLYLVTASICERVSNCPRGAACHWKPNVRQREALLAYKKDQETLKQEGKDKELLTTAFKNLPNLNQLALVGDTQFLPDSVECYGLRKFKRTTKTTPILQPVGHGGPDPEYFTCLTHVWRTMLLAVGQSGIKSIKRLETRFGCDNASGLSPITDLRFKDSTIAVLARCFANLEDLSICFRSANFRVTKPDNEDPAVNIAKAAKFMKAFAPTFRTAKNVKLGFDFGFSSGALCKAFMNSTLDLAKLTKLVLDAMCIDMKGLASLICKLKSVELLTIHHTELVEGTWVPILKALQNLPALQHLHLFYLQAPDGRVYFLEQDEVGEEDLDASPFDYITDSLMQVDADVDGNWEDSSETSEDMPDLIDGDVVIKPNTTDQEQDQKDEPLKAPSNTCSYYSPDFRDPLMSKATGRGYFVCLQGMAIQEKLPILLKEYHTRGAMDSDDPNSLLNVLAGGIVGPFPAGAGGPPPPPAAAAGQAGQGAGAAAGAQGNGAQPGAGGGVGGAYTLQNMLAGIMAGPPPPAGGNQTYSFSMPLGSLFGGFGPPPANQQQTANAAQANPPAPSTAASTAAGNPQAVPGAAAAGPSSLSATVEDDDDLPDLLSFQPEDDEPEDYDDDEDGADNGDRMNDVD